MSIILKYENNGWKLYYKFYFIFIGKAKNLTKGLYYFSIFISIFREIFYTQKVWYNYIFKKNTFFSLTLEKNVVLFFNTENTKEYKGFEPSFGEVKVWEIYKTFLPISLQWVIFIDFSFYFLATKNLCFSVCFHVLCCWFVGLVTVFW